MTLVVAVNYGARQEILHAVDALRHQAALAASEGAAELPELTEEMLERELYTADIPDPDLVIRTSGERNTILGIFSGMVLTIAVPIFVTSIFAWL